MTTTQNWFIWALLSAVFAALTAIFAKAVLAAGKLPQIIVENLPLSAA